MFGLLFVDTVGIINHAENAHLLNLGALYDNYKSHTPLLFIHKVFHKEIEIMSPEFLTLKECEESGVCLWRCLQCELRKFGALNVHN